MKRRTVPDHPSPSDEASLMTSARPPARASLAPVLDLLRQRPPYVQPGGEASNARDAS
jgi:hypothetical protein